MPAATTNANVKLKVESFFSQHQELKYKKGEIILRANDTPSGISYLKAGLVRLFTISPDGEELSLHTYSPGSFFPIGWALNQQTNKYYFESLIPSVIFRAPTKSVLAFLQENPDILLDLTSRLLLGLEGLSTKIEHLVFDRAVGKTASLLLYLSSRFGKPKNSGGTLIDVPFTHDNLASWLGVTRVSISQAMAQLKKQKLIGYEKGHIVIINPEALRRVK
jgi:CRP-like cAMP-binding protein